MPPVVVAAGITAAGALGGAALASRASNKATDAQSQANRESLAYTKQKDARSEADALRREGLWQSQYNNWQNAANQALSNWGFNGQLTPLSGYGMAAPVRGAMPAAAVRRPGPGSGSYADLVPTDPRERRDLTNEIGDWADWRRYGLE